MDKIIELTDEEILIVNKPIKGNGGFQSLLTGLQKSLVGRQLHISYANWKRVLRYARRYGGGGFQNRLEPIINAANRP